MIGVLGARGRIGKDIARGLADSGAEAVALVRRRPASGAPEKISLPETRADLRDREELARALEPVDRLLLLTPHGPDQDLLEANAIHAAKEAGVKGIVKVSGTPATLGANGPTSTGVAHWRSERLIEESGLDFVHLRPSFLMQNLLSTLAPVIRERGRAISPLADEPISMTDSRDVAEVAVTLLVAPELGRRALSISGPRPVTHREVATLLGQRLIRIPARFVPKVVRANSESPWEAEHALRMLAFYGSGADGFTGNDFEAVTGNKPRPIEVFLEENRAAFTKPTRKGISQ